MRPRLPVYPIEKFQYPLSGLNRLLLLLAEALQPRPSRFNTLCRVLIGCYPRHWHARRPDPAPFQYPLSGLNRLLRSSASCAVSSATMAFQYPLSGLNRLLPIADDGTTYDLSAFQYPLSGLNRLLLLPARQALDDAFGFNTLCRVLIGCYGYGVVGTPGLCGVSIPSVGS